MLKVTLMPFWGSRCWSTLFKRKTRKSAAISRIAPNFATTIQKETLKSIVPTRASGLAWTKVLRMGLLIQMAQSLFGGILFLLVSMVGAAQPAEISVEIKLRHLELVRTYLVAGKASAEARAAVLAEDVRPTAESLKVYEDLRLHALEYERLSETDPMRARAVMPELLLLAMKSNEGLVKDLDDFIRATRLWLNARLEAEKKSRAAAKLLDFQADLIGVLTDHHIDTNFATLEPK